MGGTRRDPSGSKKKKRNVLSFVDDKRQDESVVPSTSRHAYMPHASACALGVLIVREQRVRGVTALSEHLVGGEEGHNDEGQVTEVGDQAAGHAVVRVAAAVP